MGGAERSARKRRQTQGTVAASRKGDKKGLIIGAVVIVLLIGAVIGGIVYTQHQKNATEGQSIQTQNVDAELAALPVRRDEATVVVGKDDAKVTLDVYEDFLCPVCGNFEKTYGDKIDQALTSGKVQIHYHMLPMLNQRSDPPGYSLDSANAGLLAADAGKFLQLHKSLYADQPKEGGRGWSKDQIVDFGKKVGITSAAFTSGVQSGTYNQIINDAYEAIGSAPWFSGTPTIMNGDSIVDVNDPNWLDKLAPSTS